MNHKSNLQPKGLSGTRELQKRLKQLDATIRRCIEAQPSLPRGWQPEPTDPLRRTFQDAIQKRKAVAAELTERGASAPPASKPRSPEAESTTKRDIGCADQGIGANINRLRKDCGWSLDDLAERTGIDKKQVVSHAGSRSKPYPRNLKVYAEAFSKGLNRTITASDLEK